jgi:hypothetical protein
MLKQKIWLLLFLFLIPLFSACGGDAHVQPQPFLEGEELDVTNMLVDQTSKPSLKEGNNDVIGSIKDPLAEEPVVPKDFGGLYGFVDLEGRVVIPAQFTYAELMHEGLSYVEKGEDKFIIDAKGEVVFQIKNEVDGDSFIPFYSTWGYVDRIAVFAYGDCAPITSYRYIDRQGNDIMGRAFLWAIDFSEGLAFVKEHGNKKGGYIDKQGNYVIEMDIEKFWGYNFKEGLAVIYDTENSDPNKRMGYVNKNGDIAIPLQFSTAKEFSEGAARVIVDYSDKSTYCWGYIDLDGNWLLEPQYGGTTDFIDGKAVVNGNMVIDKSGNVIAMAPEDIYIEGPFSEGLAVAFITKNDDWFYGYVNEDFNWVIPPTFRGNPLVKDCKNGLMHIRGSRYRDDYFDYYFNRDGKLLAKNPVRD